jgi:hypothetical protein
LYNNVNPHNRAEYGIEEIDEEFVVYIARPSMIGDGGKRASEFHKNIFQWLIENNLETTTVIQWCALEEEIPRRLAFGASFSDFKKALAFYLRWG